MPIDPTMGAALISAGTSLSNSIIGAGQSRRNTVSQMKHNMAQQKRAQDWSLEMWHRQNQYNTPAEQMKRFKEAGLNPHLIYGQGDAGNAATMPKYQSFNTDMMRRQTVSLPETLGTYLSFAQQRQSIDLTREQVELAKAETGLKIAQRIGQIYGNDSAKAKAFMDSIMSNYFQDYQKLGLQQGYTDIAEKLSKIDLNEKQRRLIDAQIGKLSIDTDVENFTYKYMKETGITRLSPTKVKEVIEALNLVKKMMFPEVEQTEKQKLDELEREFLKKHGKQRRLKVPRKG